MKHRIDWFNTIVILSLGALLVWTFLILGNAL